MGPNGDPMAGIEGAIAHQDWRQALELAVSMWRKHRAAALADLVDVVSARAPGPPLPRGDLQKAWIARAKTARTIDIAPLAANISRAVPTSGSAYLDDVHRRYARWHERIAALAELPDDPRIARGLLDVIQRAPFTAVGPEDAEAIYAPVIALLVRIADERMVPSLRLLVMTPIASRQSVRQYFAKALPKACDKIEAAQKPVPVELVARAAELSVPLGGRTRRATLDGVPAPSPTDEAALFEQVVADPDGDGPREVLGDVWLERDDPRGKLVSLQLRGPGDPEAEKQVRALLREHEKTWLGPLALVSQNRVWRRGFLDELELRNNAAADPKIWEAAAASPLLGTVRTIHKGAANAIHYRNFVLSPQARSLAELTALSKALLREVCEHPSPPPIATLVLKTAIDKPFFTLLGRSLPALARVVLPMRDDGIDKLVALARQLLALRSLDAIGARYEGWRLESSQAAAWLGTELPVARELWAGEIPWITVRQGTKGVRVEIVAQTMHLVPEIVRRLGKLEHVSIAAPGGETYGWDGDPAAIASLSPAPVELDAAWRARLNRR